MAVIADKKIKTLTDNFYLEILKDQKLQRVVLNQPIVAVVVPTYCESENIERLIRLLQRLRLNMLVIVADDSSPDGTAEIVMKLQEEYDNLLLCVRPGKLGLGTAITDTFQTIVALERPPDYIVTMDADFSHNPRDIPKMINAVEDGVGLVIGSRYCQGGRIIGWHSIRWLISRVANLIASTVSGKRIHDCTSGFRCYSKECVESVLPYLHSQTYEIQIETVKQARRQGFIVREIPITFVNRKRGKSKLTKAEIIGFLVYILKSKFGGMGF